MENENTTPTNRYQERQQAKRERLEARASKAQERSAQLFKQAKDRASFIPFGQPILVGHHSEGRDRNYRAKIENGFRRSFEEQERAEELQDRAESVGQAGIASDDPEALVKLRAKLEGLQIAHARMKAANAAMRTHKANPAAQVEAIQALGYTEQQALEVVRPDFCGRVGFPAYALSLSNAEQKRTGQRIAQLERMAARPDVKEERPGYTYEESKDEGRILLRFPGIPPQEARNILKSNAFKWSRYSGAWVRKMTPNAIGAARRMAPALDAALKG